VRRGLSLSTRIIIVIVTLVVLTAVGVGYRSYVNIQSLVIPRTLMRLDASAREKAGDLASVVLNARADVAGLRSIIGIDEVIALSRDSSLQTAGGGTLADWRARIARRLVAELEVKPDLVQYRLLGIADGGREMVRVDRLENGVIRVTPDSALQRTGDQPYFQEALAANSGEIVVSPVELDREHGGVAKPLIRVAAPVFASDGARFGAVVLSIDLRPSFARLGDTINADARMYVVNDRGDYLISPDKSREFGFAFGHPFLIQQDFPALASVLTKGQPPAMMEDNAANPFGVAIAPMRLPEGTPMSVVNIVPKAKMLSVAMSVWRSSTLVGGGIAVLVAIALAVVLSRTMTRPLAEMTKAVEGLSNDGPITLPLDAAGEIGVLARAFKKMVRQSRDKTAALEREKSIFDSIMNAMAESVALLDADGKVVYENAAKRALRMPIAGDGVSPWQDEIDTFLADGVTPVPIEQRPSRRALRGETVDHFEMVVHVRQTGAVVNLLSSARPIRNAQGELSGAVIVFRTITELREAERKLHQAQKLEAIGQLTGGVAHDFNNMLTVISGTAEILLDELQDRPDLLNLARMIEQASDRGADLTRQLLAFARKQPLQPSSVDVNAIVVSVKQLLRPIIGEHIEIDARLSERLSLALIDPSQLSSSLLNLAVNARDAMPNGGRLMIETGNVELDSSYAERTPDVKPGHYIMIAVTDTGAGIPHDVIDKVFEPFFTTKSIGKGTGLGLSMVYGFVKQSGGHIQIYSEQNHGTSIKLYLPCAETVSVATPMPATVEGGGETILLVEDDDLVRNFAVAQLRSLGYRTIACEDGDAALAEAERGAAFDLLFTDVIMPGTLNGRRLADTIAQARPVKVLYTSGYTENAIMHHGRLDDGALLLVKPYSRTELARMVRAALAQVNHQAQVDDPASGKISAAR
jgi:signal transduction histidine kinase/HAMP domain-containing protein